MGNAKTILILIILSALFFNNYADADTNYASVFRFRVRTTSDWTHVQITGFGDQKLWNASVEPSGYNLVVSTENNYSSVWIGKPQYDETLVEVNLDLLSINPTDLVINISKGYIGYTGVKVSVLNQDIFREVGRISHTITENDYAFNPYAEELAQALIEPYLISMVCTGEEQEKQVLAVYYPWYGIAGENGVGRHWGQITDDSLEYSGNYPLLGAYDSLDINLIREHIELAQRYGVDGFAVSWWGIGSYEDQAYRKILNASYGFQSCIYYETNRENLPTPDGVASELNYIHDSYGSHENYLKQGEKPVIFIFNADGYGRDSTFWAEVRSLVPDVFLVGDFRDPELVEVFDGVHIYNELDSDRHLEVTGWISEQNLYLRENTINDVIQLSQNGAITYLDKLTIGTVSPGYDDTKIRLNGTSIPRLGVETYRRSWETVNSLNLDWVFITSWNEWHEGTEIEPSRENCFTDLLETQRQAKLFKKD